MMESDSMSSYRKHVIFAIILTLPFFPNVFSLALSVLGASFPDFDHKVKKKNISILFLTGLIISLVFYLLKMPYLIGLILIDLALIFYLSKHRGFTHSFLGISILSTCLTVLIVFAYFFLDAFGLSGQGILAVIVILLAALAVNKRLILWFIFLSVLGIFLTPFPGLSLYNVMCPIFLGFLSHVILDSYTPQGVEFLRPISSKRFKKSFGILLIVIWALCAAYYLFNVFS
ncbi:metal-dependent hydrolase [Methanobacterium alcaliphilum]|uniref:metal-dependent hydrolase n=1 Tax=Methanobacterium alcaliphilum TaxID=392018 RepID=UPI00200B1D0E|nr:metal-dependent hydrolase [Methanobacterium alcaliphilum]MCK9151437.1 metal-dependent hydrolase [Methanobacterium alcaliphilum]